MLGGPPGVGKTTVIQSELLGNVTCLDADDITDPKGPDDFDEAMSKIIKALEHALSASPLVLISWVFAKSELFTPLVKRFAGENEVFHIYLVANELELSRRLVQRNDGPLTKYALEKLRLIESLPFEKIDTTRIQSEQVAADILDIIQPSPN